LQGEGKKHKPRHKSYKTTTATPRPLATTTSPTETHHRNTKTTQKPQENRPVKNNTDDRNFYGVFSITISSKMTKTSPNTKENLQK
jgi:hypothetical protein